MSLCGRAGGLARRPMAGDEQGQALVEYGLLLALIAVVVAATVGMFGTAVTGLFQSALDRWPG